MSCGRGIFRPSAAQSLRVDGRRRLAGDLLVDDRLQQRGKGGSPVHAQRRGAHGLDDARHHGIDAAQVGLRVMQHGRVEDGTGRRHGGHARHAAEATIAGMADLDERMRGVAKVELHQHVDGSIPAEVTWELMRHYRLNPVDTLDEMRQRLEIQDGEEGTLLAYLDKMHYPLWITQFYENISQVTEAIVDAAAAAGVTTLELRYSPIIHTFAGLTPAAVDPRRALGDEPRVEAPPHEARPHRHRHAPARPAHREDPGPPGPGRGPAPPRPHRRGGLRHRRARARQPAAPVQERVRDRPPRPPRPHRARGRGRRPPTTSGRRSTSLGATRIGHGCSAVERPGAAPPHGPRPDRRGVLPVQQLPHRRGEARHAPSHPPLPRGRCPRRPLLRQHARCRAPTSSARA